MCTLLFIGMLTSGFGVQSLTSEPTTTTVQGYFSTIQEAINAASPGDVIHVPSGVYNENIEVNKTVWLIGNGSYSTIIIGFMIITANHTHVEGFTIHHDGDWEDSGILVYSHHNYITGNTIVNNPGLGIRLCCSNYNTILDNKITFNGQEEGDTRFRAGIWVTESNYTLISQNYIASNNDYGIRMRNSNHTLIANNTLTANHYGGILVGESSHNNVMLGNEIFQGYYGIDIAPNPPYFDKPSPFNNTVVSNNITSCADSHGFGMGIRMIETFGNTIVNNVLSDNDINLALRMAPNNIIENNVVKSSHGTGIDVFQSNYVSIRRNEVLDSGGCGIGLDDSDYCSIIGNNLIKSGFRGLGLFSNSCLVTENEIRDTVSDTGLSVCGFYNEIYNNIFINNTPNAEVLPGAGPNSWDNGTRGNFWDDYSGTGNYTISLPDNVDHYPIVFVPFSKILLPPKPEKDKPYTIALNLTNLLDPPQDIEFTGVEQVKAYPESSWLKYELKECSLEQPFTLQFNQTHEFLLNFTNDWKWIKTDDWATFVIDFVIGHIPLYGVLWDVYRIIEEGDTSGYSVSKMNYTIERLSTSNPYITFAFNVTVEVPREKQQALHLSAVSKLAAILAAINAILYSITPLGPVFATTATIFEIISYWAFVEAFDPDPNYDEIIPIEPIPPPPQLEQLPEGIEKRLALATLDLASLEKAYSISYARYEAARADNFTGYMELQLGAALTYNAMVARKLEEVRFLSSIVTAEMPTLTDYDVQFASDIIANEGLPQMEHDILEQVGLGSQIPRIIEAIVSATETSEQRELYIHPINLHTHQYSMIQSHVMEDFNLKVTAEAGNLTVEPEHNVAITGAWPSFTKVNKGDDIIINVEVENQGTMVEPSFNVFAYVDTIELGPVTILNLEPGNKTTLTFVRNTADLDPDYYRVRAVAEPVYGEEFMVDNEYVDSFVRVKEAHDVKVSSVMSFPEAVMQGETVSIYVIAENQGDFTELCNITAYANDTIIAEEDEVIMTSESSKALLFQWDTSSFEIGQYQISASVQTSVGTHVCFSGYVKVGIVDIAIANVKIAKTAAEHSFAYKIDVTISNNGNFTETVDTTVYYNLNVIDCTTTGLINGSSETLPFIWDTTGVANGNYTIAITTTSLPGEIHTANNVYINGWIPIAKIADIGGGLPPEFFKFDGKVDAFDLALFIACYRGLSPPEATYLGDLGGRVSYVPTFFACDEKVDAYDLALFIQCYKGNGPDT